MTERDAESPKRYFVYETDQCEADREMILRRVTPFLGPDAAAALYEDLQRVMMELPELPGLLANSIDESASQRFGLTVRRLLYYGPRGKRRLRTPYRILYTIIEPAEGESIGDIRVLRVLYGAQVL